MGVPVWNMSSNLKHFYEKTNILVETDVTDALSYHLVVKSEVPLPSTIVGIGTKKIYVNGTEIILGTTSSGTISSQNRFGSTSESIGAILGNSFIIRDATGEDSIPVEITLVSGIESFPLAGFLILGTKETFLPIDVDGVANISDLVTLLNDNLDNSTYGIKATDLSTNFSLTKDNMFGGDSIFIDTSLLSSGSIGITPGTYNFGLSNLVNAINNNLVNTDNITASIGGTAGSYYIQIADSSSAISFTDNGSNIGRNIRMKNYSDVSIADIVSEIDALSSTTNVSAAVSSSYLNLIGPTVNIQPGTTYSYDVVDLLFLNNLTGTSQLHNWLSISESLGVISGMVPAIPITTNVFFTVRAISSTVQSSDIVFSMTLQPSDPSLRISWNPVNIGEGITGESSKFVIPVTNIDKILNASNFYVLRNTKFTFDTNDISPWVINRPSKATYISTRGHVATAEEDVARIDYDYANGVTKGLIIEASATNHILYSTTHSQNWQTNSASLITGFTDSPDLTRTGTKLFAVSSASTSHRTYQDVYTIPDNSTYTFSVFVKAAEIDWMMLRVDIKDSSSRRAYFNAATGAKGAVVGSATSAITKLADGWYRVSISGNIGAGSTQPRLSIYLAENNNDVTFAGDGFSGIYFWGAQMETSSSATSYIYTESSTENRLEDVITIPLYTGNYTATKEGSTTNNIQISSVLNQYTLSPLVGENHLKAITINNFPQKTVLGDDNLVIDSYGFISGILPYHTPSDSVQTYQFSVILDYDGKILLPPATWSFDVKSIYDWDTSSGFFNLMLDDDDLAQWANMTSTIFTNSEIYRPLDNRFGIQNTASIGIIYNIKETDLNVLATELQTTMEGFSVVVGDMKTVNFEEYDVVYMDVIDHNSTVEQYTYDGRAITPSSIDIMRQKLKKASGTEIENLPEWFYDTYTPRIVVGFVKAGHGSNVVNMYNASQQYFKGKVIKIDKIAVTAYNDGDSDFVPF